MAEGEGTRAPQPLPLPVPAPPRRGNRTALVVVVAVLVLCACCCTAQVAVPAVFVAVFGDRLTETFESPAMTRPMQPAEAAWAGGGDHAVIQSCDDSGTARVVVWDRASGRTRTLEGYRLIAVEEATAAIWVARDAQPDNYGDPFIYQTPSGVEDGPRRVSRAWT